VLAVGHQVHHFAVLRSLVKRSQSSPRSASLLSVSVFRSPRSTYVPASAAQAALRILGATEKCNTSVSGASANSTLWQLIGLPSSVSTLVQRPRIIHEGEEVVKLPRADGSHFCWKWRPCSWSHPLSQDVQNSSAMVYGHTPKQSHRRHLLASLQSLLHISALNDTITSLVRGSAFLRQQLFQLGADDLANSHTAQYDFSATKALRPGLPPRSANDAHPASATRLPSLHARLAHVLLARVLLLLLLDVVASFAMPAAEASMLSSSSSEISH